MSVEILRRRGTTVQHSTFVGGSGELTVDTTKNVAVVHDGAQVAGFPLAGTLFANVFSKQQSVETADALYLDFRKASDGVSRLSFRASGFIASLRQEADVSPSSFELSKRGTTGNALAALSNGSAVGAMLFRGYDGTAFGDAGSVRTFTTQAWGVGAHGTQLVFATVPIGSTTETTHATLSSLALEVTSRLFLPNTTSATVGGIYFGGNRAFHNFGTGNTAAGVNAGNFTMTGTANSFFGVGVGASTTTGSYNSFFGVNAGLASTSGFRNSFFGVNAGMANIGGSEGSFFGAFAGQSNTSGGYNSFFGRSAGMSNTTGSNNCFFGYAAGKANTTASNNSFFGFRAGLVSTGAYNSFFGRDAGVANTSGYSNSFFGRFAGRDCNTGSFNCFLGVNVGLLTTTGGSNSFFGAGAGAVNTTGNNNTFFGFQAGNNLTTGSNNIVLGYDIDSPTATNSNTLTIGNLIFGTGVDGVGVGISSGNVGIGVITPLSRLHVGGLFRVDTGFFNDAGGFKHARVTTGSVGAGTTALVTITWATAFADANYTVNASVLDATTSSLSLSVVHVETITAAAVTVRVLNNAIGALTGEVHVIAVHD